MVRRNTYMAGVLVAILILTAFVQSGQVQAATTNWRNHWDVQVNFIGDEPNALLTVTVEQDTGTGWKFYAENISRLHCTTAPGVTLTSNTAVFSGTGAIQCQMPSVRELVQQMTSGRYTPNETCNCKGNPTINTKVVLDPNITGTVWDNPLVYRMDGTKTDMALDVPVPAYSTIPMANMTFAVNEYVASSNSFLANARPNTLMATYANLGAALQPVFIANGANPGTGALPVAKLSVTYMETDLFIGYSPVTGASLHGTLESLQIDPGCYGTG